MAMVTAMTSGTSQPAAHGEDKVPHLLPFPWWWPRGSPSVSPAPQGEVSTSLGGAVTEPRGIKQTPGGQRRQSPVAHAVSPHPRCGPRSLAELSSLSLFSQLHPSGFASSPWSIARLCPEAAELRDSHAPPCRAPPGGRLHVCAPPDGDAGPCPSRGWMNFGTLQPTQDPHSQPGRVTRKTGFPRAGSYGTSSSAHVPNTQPLPRPHRAGTATDSPRTRLQPLAHTDSCTGALPSDCSAHPAPPDARQILSQTHKLQKPNE